MLHEAAIAHLLDFGHERKAEIIRRRAGDRLIFKSADAVELRFIKPFEQKVEVGVGLTGKTDNESRAQAEIGTGRAPGTNAIERLLLIARPTHRLGAEGLAC